MTLGNRLRQRIFWRLQMIKWRWQQARGTYEPRFGDDHCGYIQSTRTSPVTTIRVSGR